MLKHVDLTTDRATQVCAVCHKENALDLSRLKLGVATGPHRNSGLLVLPACPCGAQETLCLTMPEAFANAPASPHHLAVNRLAHHLRTKGRVHPDLAASVAAETEAPHGAVKLAHVTKFTPAELAREFAGDTGTKG